MIQRFLGKNIRVMGRTVMDGGMLWLLSSLSEAGFRVSGATFLRLVLRADHTVDNETMQHLTPRYMIRLDGEEKCVSRMTGERECVPVFSEERHHACADIFINKLSMLIQNILIG